MSDLAFAGVVEGVCVPSMAAASPGWISTLMASSLRFLCPCDCICFVAVDCYFRTDDDMAARTPTVAISIRFWEVGMEWRGMEAHN